MRRYFPRIFKLVLLVCFFQMDVYKQPVTDPSKGSKRGRLSLRRNSDGFLETVERGAGKPEEVRTCHLKLAHYL